MSSNQKPFAQALVKSAVVGGIAYVGSAYLLGADADLELPMLGVVSSSTAVGLATGTASLVGGLATNYLLPMIHQKPGYENMEASTIQPALVAGSTLLVAKMLGDVPSPLMIMAYGAGVEIGGEYLYNGFVAPMI